MPFKIAKENRVKIVDIPILEETYAKYTICDAIHDSQVANKWTSIYLILYISVCCRKIKIEKTHFERK